MMMEGKYRRMGSLLSVITWLMSINQYCHCAETDVECLRSLQQSLVDPDGNMNTWSFQNSTLKGFFCGFNGVECWNVADGRVLDLKLSNMRLQGRFPTGLASCTSLTSLDFSNNQLSGPLPTDISHYPPFLSSLDLFMNKFYGGILADLEKSAYLNVLRLDHNQFTGEIHSGIGRLSRLHNFSMADNKLMGSIPPFLYSQPAESFANNTGLCGPPLQVCQSPAKKGPVGVILFIALLVFIVLMLLCAFV